MASVVDLNGFLLKTTKLTVLTMTFWGLVFYCERVRLRTCAMFLNGQFIYDHLIYLRLFMMEFDALKRP